MEAANREETGAELAAVTLLLGIIFADLQPSGPVPYSAYLQEFNRLVRPRLTRFYGKAYEHNGWIPRDQWLDESEKQAIFEERDRKLAEARQRRAEARTAAQNKANAASSASSNTRYTDSDAAEDRALLGSTLSATALPLTDEGSRLSEITSNSAATASSP